MMEWQKLENSEQLEEILSSEKPTLIFKHSTRCHISSMALSGFKRSWSVSSENCSIYLLDLIAFRELSNEVANRTGVAHQSPQIILVKNGAVLHSASHHGIDANETEAKLA
jgi:bacillithiol system protein YtxJ